MELQESGEMYLETIYVLSEKMSAVRSLDVAEYMDFSKPSVSRAVKLLREGGYINVDKNGYITLTGEGHSVAVKIFERHNFLRDLLVRIGVDEKTASADACKLEHSISDVSFAALKNYIQNHL